MMPSRATLTFAELDRDVGSLIAAHPSAARTAGRPAGDTGPLRRSIIVLMSTAWENYVEQATREAFDVVIRAVGDDHSKLLGDVRSGLAALTKNNPWALAGDAWKTEAEKLVERQVSALNNAGPGQINGLFHFAFGLTDFVESLGWQGQPAGKVASQLGVLINEIRGDIVHRGTTTHRLNKRDVESWRTFVKRVVAATDVALADAINTNYGVRPW